MATFTSVGFKRTNLDADALDYIEKVEFADGQPLESGISKAFNDFVIGLKADNLWNSIDSMAILAGARTLNGALIPLKGPSPSNNNFVSDDYNRFGLQGDGSTKYLNSNFTPPSNTQNNVHISVWLTETHTPEAAEFYNASIVGSNGLQMFRDPSDSTALFTRVNSSATLTGGNITGPGFIGASRNNSNDYIIRTNNTSETITRSSVSINQREQYIFARNNNNNAQLRANARLSFYSTGESLTLADLDTRLTNLINAIGGVLI